MTIDLDALEKLADEATPGPWAWVGDDLKSVSNSAIVIADLGYDGMWIPTEGADAAFVAGANPAAIKALIAELREASALLTEIAKGEVGPERHGHYLAHRRAVNSARTFLARNGKGEG